MSIHRRSFIRTAFAVPFILPSHIWSADPAPSERVTIGMIGMGKMNNSLLKAFGGNKKAQVVAVCDVDTNRRESAKQKAEAIYAQDKPAGWTGCTAHADYRDLLARKDIDAVIIATPDHWHALQTIHALEAGKDVYCEKPLTHNIHEAIRVMESVQKHGRILQTGSMQRSMQEFRVAAEIARNGVLGKIKEVIVGFGGPALPHQFKEDAMEPGLDWNSWQGPAPVRPYSTELCPRGVHDNYPNWRWASEYGGGGVCDFGAHNLDIAHWGLDMDASGPVEIVPSPGSVEKMAAGQNRNIDGAVLTYPNGVKMRHDVRGFGVHFICEDGEVKANRGKFEATLKGEVIASKVDNTGISVERAYMMAQNRLLKDAPVKLYKSPNHHDDFLNAVKSRLKPVAHEIIGARTAIGCHLINIAYRTGKTLKWDPVANQFRENSCDPAELTRVYRDGFSVS